VLVATKPIPEFVAFLSGNGVAVADLRVDNKFDFSRILAIRGLIRRFGADIVHTHLSTAAQWGMIAAHFAGVPCVAHVHAMNRAIWYIWATRIIACAEAVRDHLVSQGLPAERISVVHNAVEVEGLPGVDRVAVRRHLGLEPETPVIVAAAHLSPKKGLHVLLRALPALCADLPGLRCLMLGEGPQRQELEALARELGVGAAATFLGYRADARDIMAAVDVVCLPSVSGEGLPLVVLEAAARRRPVVVSRLAGLQEAVIEGETGFVVSPGDATELADRLRALLADRGLRERLGQAGRELVARRFNRATQAARVEEVYRLALAEKRAASTGRRRR
jgi:glycosyltransferase involved in cell wall biosynthesis